jgi:hypothetical protein
MPVNRELDAVPTADDGTSRRTEANRRNAKKSTGPKNTANTRHNAVSHGLLATEPTPLDGEGYVNVLEQLLAELKPVGILERLAVGRMALSIVRLRRIPMLEVNYLAQHRKQQTKRLARSRASGTSEQLLRSVAAVGHGYQLEMGKARLLKSLEKIVALLQDAEFKDDNVKGAWESIVRLIPAALEMPANIRPELTVADPAATCIQDKTTAERERATELKNLVTFLEERAENLNLGAEATQALEEIESLMPLALGLDPAQDIDVTSDLIGGMNQLQRYETSLDNQYSKALNQVERLQRIRSGEFLPPPLSMDVSIHGAASNSNE